MKAAAVFPGKKAVGLVDLEEPAFAGPQDVKFRILEVGLCGTDREICAFEYGDPPAGSDFLVLGHESLGEVVEVGPEVQGWKPGDLVVPSVRRPCDDPSCTACRAGRQDFCYSGRFTERGINKYHGFMTERVVEHQQYLNHVPEELRSVAVLVEPLTIAEKGLLQVEQVQQRLPWNCPEQQGQPKHYCRKVLVLGAGPVGLLGAMTLRVAGFETYVYSRGLAPNAASGLCDQIGAKYVSSRETNNEQLAAKIGNIDLVYEAVGATQISFDILQVLGVNGVFVFTGLPPLGTPATADLPLIMRNLVLKNQLVLGTVNAGQDAFHNAISNLGEFYKRWPDAVKALITGRFSLDDCADPINTRSGIKNVIEVGA